MKYGYFDGEHKEYVITRPDTPAPWANYLGSPEYGAIISGNAGGYSFVKSGANGRIIRYRFNSIMSDQPGRYIYLRDRENGDFWSASWQPVGKSLDRYTSECHHGTAYTRIVSTYDDIQSETLYYVPLNKTHEVWRTRITNTGTRPRKLSVTGYVEFTNSGNYEQDSVNLQYTLFTSKTYFRGNKILQAINENIKGHAGPDDSDENGAGIWRFFGLAGAEAARYDGDRDIFVGNYRDYSNPYGIEKGCTNTLNFNGNSCGALQSDIELAPGETKELIYLLGAYAERGANAIQAHYQNAGVVDREWEELKSYWHSRLNRFQVKTPSDNLNHMVNTWNAYQCFITFVWSRAASFQYCGLRNGLGYRDTVQDIQGIMHLDPEMARERLTLMLSAQVSNGGGLPLVKFDHNPGHEKTPDDPEYGAETGHPAYRADDALWLFPTLIRYLKESGNWGYVDEVIPYADKEAGTVYDHMKRAIQFSLDRMGPHNMPAGLHADWNDCLRLGAKGESLFVAFQLYMAYNVFQELAERKGNEQDVAWAIKKREELDRTIQENAWEVDQFIRGFMEEGGVIGSREDTEASIWLEPQTWSVLSGAARPEQAKLAMDSVYQKLNTKYGAMVCYPPINRDGHPVLLMSLFNPTTKENGGIFSQPQGWLILAESILGNGNRAFEYFQEINPASMNEEADIRKIEPYVHGQFVEAVDSPFFGRGHVHWLTGTASTVMVSLAEGIMGVQPQFDGLKIDPCVPEDWKEFSLFREFRGKALNIQVQNPQGVQKGVKSIVLNGEELSGSVIPEDRMKAENEVVITMG
ncbi:GH36-type glycosyl hydrolase domain-containing protein [Gorillibacterium sp. sgz500922]|uniref:GH36-type glycosyl hydrolase domain-containing protein n=1 Tax=Gorillibacterium sp. sgz500922 TaxID=3446694 RepID=UPI003F66A441